MINAQIGGRTVPLDFNLMAMDRLEKRRGKPLSVKELAEELGGDRHFLIEVLLILAEEGADAAGEELAVDESFLLRKLHLGELADMIVLILGAITQGMRMETLQPRDPSKPRDLLLEELEKKETGG